MGKIEIDHTGSGGGITLSSDGTSLLLGGTAIGGGASAYTIDNKTGAYTVVSGDLGKIINCSSGTFTISLTSAATLGAGWYCWIYNTDDGASNFAVTIDPDGSETIGFKSTIVLRQLEGVKIVSDGTNWLVGDDRKSLFFQQNYRAGFFTPSSATGLLSTAIGRGATSSAGDSFAAGSGSAGSGAKAAGNGSVVLGNAYASGTDSFAAAITNNTSSYGAAGQESVAIGKLAKATALYSASLGGWQNTSSGSYAVTAGSNNTASATRSIAIGGHDNVASGTYSAILGGIGNTASGSFSRAGGYFADTQNIVGKDAYASYSFANDGDQQRASLVLFCDTTDATAEALRSNTSAAGTTNQVILPNNSAYAFHGTIVARQNASAGTASAAWKIEGLIRREGSAGTTTLVNSATTVLDNTPSWGMALSADTTNGGLAITVTGAASTNIRWVGTIHTSEVTYA